LNRRITTRKAFCVYWSQPPLSKKYGVILWTTLHFIVMAVVFGMTMIIVANNQVREISSYLVSFFVSNVCGSFNHIIIKLNFLLKVLRRFQWSLINFKMCSVVIWTALIIREGMRGDIHGPVPLSCKHT